jgi:hypothetical protein
VASSMTMADPIMASSSPKAAATIVMVEGPAVAVGPVMGPMAASPKAEGSQVASLRAADAVVRTVVVQMTISPTAIDSSAMVIGIISRIERRLPALCGQPPIHVYR